MTDKTVIAFDLYGTLLSTDSIADALAGVFDGDVSADLATKWRRYQLEYTWRANIMGTYRSFSDITRAALKHTVAEKGLTLADEDADKLMEAYNELETFPDVNVAVDLALDDPSLDLYLFSNGTEDMISKSVAASAILSKIECFAESERIVTAHAVEAFKPDPKVYAHFAEKAGVELDKVWVVTANPFDALGARAAGAQSAWIDRAGTGWIDALGGLVELEPTIIKGGVDEAIMEIMDMSDGE